MIFSTVRGSSFMVLSMIVVSAATSACRTKKSINVNTGTPTGTDGTNSISLSTAPAPVGGAAASGLALADAKPLPAGALTVEGGQYYLMPLPKQGNAGTATQGEFTHQYFKIDGTASPYLANKAADSWTIGKGSLDTESMMYEAQTDAPKFNLKWDPATKAYSGVQQTWTNNQWTPDPNFKVSTGGGTGNWTFQPDPAVWKSQSGTQIEQNPNVYNSNLFTGGGTSGVAALQQQPPVMQFNGYGTIAQQLQKPGFASGNATVYNPQIYANNPAATQYSYVPEKTPLDNLLNYIINPYNRPN